MEQFASLKTCRVESFEELSEVIAGTRRDIVQIGRGQIRGRLVHASVKDLPIDLANFNLGVRSRGESKKERLIICMLTGSANRVTRSSYESHPGDVMVTAPGAERENRYYGGASICAIAPTISDIEAVFCTEAQRFDPATWYDRQFSGNADTIGHVIPRLRTLIGRLGTAGANLTEEASEFWKRALIEAMTKSIMEGLPSERNGPLPSALRTIRQVEEVLDAQGATLMHISQICAVLRISRRTLHRAFREVLGVGPIAFLRYRRLCSVHTALRSDSPPQGTIADVALQYGFLNVGRFAQYYHELFGEYPSDTRRRRDAAYPATDERHTFSELGVA